MHCETWIRTTLYRRHQNQRKYNYQPSEVFLKYEHREHPGKYIVYGIYMENCHIDIAIYIYVPDIYM